MNPLVANVLFWHIFLAKHLLGITPRFLSGFRTSEQQAVLFRGRQPDGNPVRFPGTSQHEFGFAYDLAPEVFPASARYHEQLHKLRDIGLSLGMRWGGDDDPQHWQAFPGAFWDSIFGPTPSAGFSRGVA